MMRARYAAVQSARLAPTSRQEDAPEVLIVRGPQDVVGAVGRSIGDDDHLEAVLRVVELTQIVELFSQVKFLVVRRDDQAEMRQRRLRLVGASLVATEAEIAPVALH